ncbi:MAG: hypothetical protein Ct9H300mP28_07810 [Pseudomonadota bacterium]|nr:MAG: hypothetical protein Ct9H300mP28_07810 [Pseudomonadota bacterium]
MKFPVHWPHVKGSVCCGRAQGVEAQTLANVYMALDNNLEYFLFEQNRSPRRKLRGFAGKLKTLSVWTAECCYGKRKKRDRHS